MISDAMLSADGRYRYRLSRQWGEGDRMLTFVMLNPSTADAELDDPTIRRCMGFARREEFDGIYVVNLYAFRATDPKEMKRAIDPVGPENDALLRFAFRRSAEQRVPVVTAWGTHGDPDRVRRVKAMLVDNEVAHLGLTKNGHPRHPLYVPAAQPFEPWSFSTLSGVA